jgi:tRNA dimethylallyltransferase
MPASSSSPLPPVVLLFGPTASGKTSVSLELAHRWNGEVINADSRQIYKYMPIIAACPSAEEYAQATHHMFEFLDPAERFSAGAWRDAAVVQIEELLARGKTPILVGGTGFYLRTLQQGMGGVPVVPQSAEEPFANIPAPQLHAQLAKVDPELAATLHPNDTQRITRALAVQAHTGRPLSAWQQDQDAGNAPAPYRFITLALSPPRDVLHARIAARWEIMKQMGVLAETAALMEKGYTPDMPGLTGLGIVELMEQLQGKLTEAEARERILAKMRQYAKRQVTWLRHNYGADFCAETGAELLDMVPLNL